MKKLLALTLIVLSLVLVNCKSKPTDPEPAKTLNKSLFTNKYWETADKLQGHYFRSDGKYCSPDGIMEFGTWQWLNNSDSLEVIETTFGRSVWYAEYCTETELKMKISGSNWDIYTKQ